MRRPPPPDVRLRTGPHPPEWLFVNNPVKIPFPMHESILVVDDEPFVLNAICGILRHAGYTVLTAAAPREALRIAQTHPGTIHLLLSDVVMPEMSGPSLSQLFAAIHPETLLLFVAGMPYHPEILERVLPRGQAFLAKPFRAEALVRKVRELLAPAGALVA